MAPTGTRTPIDRGLVDRLAGVVKGAFRGAREEWFGPLQPLPPVAPPDVKGRAFDFPVGWNTAYTPRGEQGENGISFAQLRALADPTRGGLDLLRLAIETRKDQMASQRWDIQARDGNGDGGKKARDIAMSLRRPDRIRRHGRWQRKLLEDLLVIDAPTIYLAPGGERGWKIPQVMDGALIKPLLQIDGREPLPPSPAYQQILKGSPAIDYSLDELIYAPRNERSDHVYGMSPVEQVVMTVSIALRRQVSQLEYYTAGSVPDVAFECPKEWTLGQIKEYQDYWDSVLSGNTAERRRARFVPNGAKPMLFKEGQLKDEFDEWLARVICFCFSLSPQAFVKQMNRATSETAKEAATEEGLEPLKLHWKDMMDDVLEKGFSAPELEYVFIDEEITDPETKAKVVVALAGGPILTKDEGREMYGRALLTPEQKLELRPPSPSPSSDELPPGGESAAGTQTGSDGEGGNKSDKIAKSASARRSLRPIDRDRSAVALGRELVAASMRNHLAGQRAKLVKTVHDLATKVAKAAMRKDELERLYEELDEEGRRELVKMIAPQLKAVALDGAAEALRQADKDGIAKLLEQANAQAIAWAKRRAAELVKGIDETTRDGLQSLTTQALEDGWSNDRLADEISDAYWFSDSRAETVARTETARAELIARTETARADVQGNIAGWKASGVVEKKQWLAAQDEVECEVCNALDGIVVGLEDEFPNDGGDGPPDPHPNCRCNVVAVLAEDALDAE